MSDQRCTWTECNYPAEFKWVDERGKTWAHVCGEHNQQLKQGLREGAPQMIAAWTSAQGGMKRALERLER